MKTLFIPAYKKSFMSENAIYNLAEKLPDNIAVAYSVQYKAIAEEIVKDIAKTHKIVFFGQVLGCSKPIFPKGTQAILLVSNGKFHAISLAFETKFPTYLYDEGKFEKVSDAEIQSLERKQKAAYLKYLHADKVGIVISTKPGQERLKRALELKKKNNNKKKKCYFFMSNGINTNEFENFPDIQSWVNTACPRLNFDYPILNIAELDK